MMGERSPVWDPYARGVFFGLSLKTTRREMNRAVLEGCAYGLRQLIEMVEPGSPRTEADPVLLPSAAVPRAGSGLRLKLILPAGTSRCWI